MVKYLWQVFPAACFAFFALYLYLLKKTRIANFLLIFRVILIGVNCSESFRRDLIEDLFVRIAIRL